MIMQPSYGYIQLKCCFTGETTFQRAESRHPTNAKGRALRKGTHGSQGDHRHLQLHTCLSMSGSGPLLASKGPTASSSHPSRCPPASLPESCPGFFFLTQLLRRAIKASRSLRLEVSKKEEKREGYPHLFYRTTFLRSSFFFRLYSILRHHSIATRIFNRQMTPSLAVIVD